MPNWKADLVIDNATRWTRAKRPEEHRNSERRERAQELGFAQMEATEINVRKLAKERLGDLAEQFYEVAQYFRVNISRLKPLPDKPSNSAKKNGARNISANVVMSDYVAERLDQFYIWGKIAMECYARTVRYESPSVRAVVVGQLQTEADKARASDELLAELLEEMRDREVCCRRR